MGWKIWAGLGWVWTFFHFTFQGINMVHNGDSRGAAILAFFGFTGAVIWLAILGVVLLFGGRSGSHPAWVRWAPAGMGLTLILSMAIYLHSGGMC